MLPNPNTRIFEGSLWICCSFQCLSANEKRVWHGSMWNTWHAASMWSWTLIPPLINTAWWKVFWGHSSHLVSDTHWQMLCISGLPDQYVIRKQCLGGMSINSGLSAPPHIVQWGWGESGGGLFNSELGLLQGFIHNTAPVNGKDYFFLATTFNVVCGPCKTSKCRTHNKNMKQHNTDIHK